jgi:hypothetical protein
VSLLKIIVYIHLREWTKSTNDNDNDRENTQYKQKYNLFRFFRPENTLISVDIVGKHKYH